MLLSSVTTNVFSGMNLSKLVETCLKLLKLVKTWLNLSKHVLEYFKTCQELSDNVPKN